MQTIEVTRLRGLQALEIRLALLCHELEARDLTPAQKVRLAGALRRAADRVLGVRRPAGKAPIDVVAVAPIVKAAA